jgi:hypothetical protein
VRGWFFSFWWRWQWLAFLEGDEGVLQERAGSEPFTFEGLMFCVFFSRDCCSYRFRVLRFGELDVLFLFVFLF